MVAAQVADWAGRPEVSLVSASGSVGPGPDYLDMLIMGMYFHVQPVYEWWESELV